MEATAKPSWYVQLADSPAQIVQVVNAVMEAVREVVEWVNEPHRRGGYFCLVNRDGNAVAIPTLILGIGEVAAGSAFECLASCQKKARRLIAYRAHISSRQSGEAGAIAVKRDVLSFAGLGQLADETVVLGVALKLELSSRYETKMIAEGSRNRIFPSVFRQLLAGGL